MSTRKAVNKNAKWGGQPASELKVQVDRWPLTADEPTGYVLTIICVQMFAGKPDGEAIRNTLRAAAMTIGSEV